MIYSAWLLIDQPREFSRYLAERRDSLKRDRKIVRDAIFTLHGFDEVPLTDVASSLSLVVEHQGALIDEAVQWLSHVCRRGA